MIFVASEAVPFAKTGGLADVIGALPRALERQGHTIAVFLPAYRCVRAAGQPITRTGIDLKIPVGSELIEGSVYTSVPSGSNVPFYLIDQPRYFDRDGIYGEGGADYPDNAQRFIFFNLAVLEALQSLGLRPDVIHCNDWQTGLVPAYLKTRYQRAPALGAAGSLLTIHNLAYLGRFPRSAMGLTGLDWGLFNPGQLEFHGSLCFLKAGLVFADMLNAVSPTYAREIQTPAFGSGLDGLLRYRRADLWGIVNGIDTDLWSPSREPALIQRYDVRPCFRASRFARPGCKRGPVWPSGRRFLSLPRSGGLTGKKVGTCWPKSPIGCWSETSRWSCWAKGSPSTMPCSLIWRGGIPTSSGLIWDSAMSWPTRSRPAPIFR